jgi:hypothetical protein
MAGSIQQSPMNGAKPQEWRSSFVLLQHDRPFNLVARGAIQPLVLALIKASAFGPRRRLLRDSNMSGVGGKEEVLGEDSKRHV